MRFDVYKVDLDPTVGSEIQKYRPCIIVSPSEMNRSLRTVIIAPMTTSRRSFPSRVDCHFHGKDGQIALDQLRTIDKSRLSKRMGKIENEDTQQAVCDTLMTMFSFY
jgi:mRNA interferase MazF